MFLWKCTCTVIIACLKCQVKNHYKVANYEYTKKFRISNSNLSNTLNEKRENMIDIITQKILFLQFNIRISIVVHSFKIKVLFLSVIWYKYDGGIYKIQFLCFGL